MTVMITFISIILKGSFQSKWLYLLLGNNTHSYPNTKRTLSPYMYMYWEEDCCHRSVQSFPSLSTASLHFFASPTAPAPAPRVRSPPRPVVAVPRLQIGDPGNNVVKSAQMQREGRTWGRPTFPLPHSFAFPTATTAQAWTRGSDFLGLGDDWRELRKKRGFLFNCTLHQTIP